MFESNTQRKALKVARSVSGTPIMANDRNFLPSAKLITTCCMQHVVQKIILLPLQLRWMEFAYVVLSKVSFSWRALENCIHPLQCFWEKNVFVTSPVIEMIDLVTEVEGLTLSIAIQQTTRFTSTLSNMLRWKFLLVEVTTTASMQL